MILPKQKLVYCLKLCKGLCFDYYIMKMNLAPKKILVGMKHSCTVQMQNKFLATHICTKCKLLILQFL